MPSPQTPQVIFGFTLAILAALFWAVAIVLSKYALAEIHSNQLFLIQLIAAAVVAWVVILVRRQRVPLTKSAILAYATGFFEPFLAYTLSLYGLAFVSAGIASLIYSTETILIILLSLVILKTKIQSPWLLSAFIAVAFSGSILAAYGDIGSGADADASQKIIGYGLVFAGVFFAALYVVVSAKLVQSYPPAILLTGQLSFCVALAALLIAPFVRFAAIAPTTLALAIVSGVLQYYLAFFCYLFSLKHLKIHTAGAVLYLIPVFGIALAVVVLGEMVTAVQLLGVALVLASLLGLHFRYERNGA